MSYTSLQAIREMAGVQNLRVSETPAGTVDGSNKNFYVSKLPLVDTQYVANGGIQASDVIFYDDGVPVTVNSVTAATGLIVLASAPATSSVVKVNYSYSSVSDARVIQVRNEAESWLNTRVASVVDVDTLSPTPAVFATITDLYAAGLILIRDYGSSADTDLSSKDGYKKMEMAQKLLDEYIKDKENDSDSTSDSAIAVTGDGNIFERNTDLTNDTSVTPDDYFFNKDN